MLYFVTVNEIHCLTIDYADNRYYDNSSWHWSVGSVDVEEGRKLGSGVDMVHQKRPSQESRGRCQTSWTCKVRCMYSRVDTLRSTIRRGLRTVRSTTGLLSDIGSNNRVHRGDRRRRWGGGYRHTRGVVRAQRGPDRSVGERRRVSWTTGGEIQFYESPGTLVQPMSLGGGGGTYRLRIAGKGRQLSQTRDGVVKDPFEHYSLYLWPESAERPPQVLQ